MHCLGVQSVVSRSICAKFAFLRQMFLGCVFCHSETMFGQRRLFACTIISWHGHNPKRMDITLCTEAALSLVLHVPAQFALLRPDVCVNNKISWPYSIGITKSVF